MRTHEVTKCTAVALEVKKGDSFRIVQAYGPQIADVVAFNLRDLSETLSPGNTRNLLGHSPEGAEVRINVLTGDTLFSSAGDVMMTILADTYGKNDILCSPCTAHLNQTAFGMAAGYPGCRELLSASLRRWGIGYNRIPNPLNVFQNTVIRDNKIIVDQTRSKLGDHVLIRAEKDLLVGISSCPAPVNEPVGVRVEVITVG